MVWSGSYDQFPDHSDGWIAYAPVSAEIEVEVAFLIKDSFYFGPDDDLTDESKQRFSEPIYQPALAMQANRRVLSSEVQRNPEELIKYYRDVIRLAGKHGKPLSPAGPYFWLRPVILKSSSELVSFGWSDTFAEAVRFLSSTRTSTDGQLFWNVDQGWHVEIIGQGADIFVRAGDPHYKRTFRCFGTSRERFSEQSSTIEGRIRRIKSILIDAIGTNYWDYPPPRGGVTGTVPEPAP